MHFTKTILIDFDDNEWQLFVDFIKKQGDEYMAFRYLLMYEFELNAENKELIESSCKELIPNAKGQVLTILNFINDAV
jgi:hypothetical protein